MTGQYYSADRTPDFCVPTQEQRRDMKNRVTEYKVCRAIASGVPLLEAALVQATQRPAHEVHQVLAKLHPDQFGTPGVDMPYRNTATVDELVAYARPIAAHRGIDEILEWEHWPHACACGGPRDGDPLCPCAMSAELARHRAEVAAQLMAEQGVETSDD